MTLGIICGCMPYVATTLKRWNLHSAPFAFFRGFRSLLSSRRHHKQQRSKRSGSSSDEQPDSRPSQDFRLETRILGGVKGSGRFLDSHHPKQREWMDRTIVTQQSLGATAIPEGWERESEEKLRP